MSHSKQPESRRQNYRQSDEDFFTSAALSKRHSGPTPSSREPCAPAPPPTGETTPHAPGQNHSYISLGKDKLGLSFAGSICNPKNTGWPPADAAANFSKSLSIKD